MTERPAFFAPSGLYRVIKWDLVDRGWVPSLVADVETYDAAASALAPLESGAIFTSNGRAILRKSPGIAAPFDPRGHPQAVTAIAGLQASGDQARPIRARTPPKRKSKKTFP